MIKYKKKRKLENRGNNGVQLKRLKEIMIKYLRIYSRQISP